MRLIDADVLRESFDSNTWQGEMMIAVVDAQPAIEAAPVVHGYNKSPKYHDAFECSVCGYEDWDTMTCKPKQHNYCPNCGANMRKEKKHETN